MRQLNFTVGGLFSGIGGIELAFQNADFDIAFMVEKDDFCQKVLAKNFPDVPIHGDIYECKTLPHVDVLTAGFPCQPFSIAGKGLGDQDERYLVPEIWRIINEVQPKVVFLENVPRFATLDGGRYFALLIRWFAENGYDAQWHHLSASDIGAPHKRERWFCVAYANSEHPRTIPPIGKRHTLRHESHPIRRIRSTKLGNAKHIRSKRNRSNRFKITHTRYSDMALLTRSGDRGHRESSTSIESGLGRTANGIPYRLDRHQFPAPRNVPQHEWEPSRVTTRKDLRRDRIQALGNAVVPQVIYPIAQMIYEYLEETYHAPTTPI